jgi:hypothetical protein
LESPTRCRPTTLLRSRKVLLSNTRYSLDDGRLADVDRKLALVREVTPVGLAHLQRIAERAQELIRLAEQATAAPTRSSSKSGRHSGSRGLADRA